MGRSKLPLLTDNPQTKVCSSRGVMHPSSYFSINHRYKDRLGSWCKGCKNEQSRDWGKNNKDRRKDNALKKNFGITLLQYNSVLDEQNHKCMICRRHESEFKNSFAVDHCHKSGKVRGLLCMDCNVLLGHYENKPELFQQFNFYIHYYESESAT